MNYYQHHIGDFNNATRHLTRIERSIYRDMIELYYDMEGPLMTDINQLNRRVMARTDEEKEAVATILSEFFRGTEDGWRHERCDDEINKVAGKMEEADDRRKNERERQARHRERRKSLFAQLREFGEVPDFETSTDALQTSLDTHLSRVTSQVHTEPATANHKPLPNNQIPNNHVNVKSIVAAAPDLLSETEDLAAIAERLAANVIVDAIPPSRGDVGDEVRTVFTYWQQAMGHPRAHLDNKRLKAIKGRLKDGYSPEDLCRAVDGCKLSDHHMGKNDSRAVYDDIELICRDGPKVDFFLKKAGTAGQPSRTTNQQTTMDNLQAYLEKNG